MIALLYEQSRLTDLQVRLISDAKLLYNVDRGGNTVSSKVSCSHSGRNMSKV